MAELQTFRDYQISQDHSGGTVEVWRSSDEVSCLAVSAKTQQFVELHVAIHSSEQPRDAQRFRRLVDEAATVRHPHVLEVMEGGEDEGANFYVTAFLDGERLDTWLARCNPLPPWLALQVTLQLTSGLSALTNHPRLLAGVELFHAAVTLLGDSANDLHVKLCDLGLAGAEPVLREPREIEAHTIQSAGRLLLYMLTGTLTDGPVTADLLTSANVAPELGFLLGTIFQSSAQHHPRTVAQLRTLVDRCARDLSPELLARPERIPPGLRPRLPLQPHFLPPSTVADAVHDDYTLDLRAFDAAAPYQMRATRRSTREPVTVQVLPPAFLLPAGEVTGELEHALSQAPRAGHLHLLRLLEWNAETHPDVLVEESPGRWSLESMVRCRGRLEPDEVRFVLTKLSETIAAANEAGLIPVWQDVRGLLAGFTGNGGDDALPPEAKLARTPLTEWPEFHIKVRTWPTALRFTQPERYQIATLVAGEPGSPDPRAPQLRENALPGGRDFALLALWMMGGTSAVPESLRPPLYDCLGNRSDAAAGTADEFLARFSRRVDLLLSGRTGRVTAAAREVAEEDGEAFDFLAREREDERGTPFAEAAEEDEEGPAVGFAEALFGHAPEADDGPADFPFFGGAPDSYDEPSSDSPLGEGLPGLSRPASRHVDYDDADDEPESAAGNRLVLWLMVVLIAAAIAGVLAHITGFAVWQSASP